MLGSSHTHDHTLPKKEKGRGKEIEEEVKKGKIREERKNKTINTKSC